jgi:tRNA-2-methylthio-N6-dimethylallyladenosine synthase
MRRGYTTALYRERVARLREHVPDLVLGSDWIVGFPGESDADFAASVGFLREIGTVQNYVFQYSPRPETRAFELADDVPAEVKKARNQELLRASEEVALAYHRRALGAEHEVFVEEELAGGRGLRGRTRHNLTLSFAGPAELVGRSVRVRAEDASPFGLWGSTAVLEPRS